MYKQCKCAQCSLGFKPSLLWFTKKKLLSITIRKQGWSSQPVCLHAANLKRKATSGRHGDDECDAVSIVTTRDTWGSHPTGHLGYIYEYTSEQIPHNSFLDAYNLRALTQVTAQAVQTHTVCDRNCIEEKSQNRGFHKTMQRWRRHTHTDTLWRWTCVSKGHIAWQPLKLKE